MAQGDAEPLDRDATVALVDDVGKWAEAQIGDVAENRPKDEGDNTPS